ncbi:MAG: ABC transporter permease [candidate division Zixibacteria bacterium]|nr:ABC transporter permease [candidate division Zixibacteria bacterium]
MQRIKFIARKELYHILRDPRSLMIVFAMPVMMTFLYGYAINMDIEHVTLAVVDQDKTADSRDLVSRFYNSGYFDRPAVAPDLSDIEQLFRSGRAAAVLIVRPGFGSALTRHEKFDLGLVIDGADASLGAAVQAYTTALVNQYQIDKLPIGTHPPGVFISRQVLYNPDLKSSHFFVPGLLGVILMTISALLTSITIAREKETGTLEQLLTTPVTAREILIGKLLPYVVIAFLDGALIVTFATLMFDVPFVGSHLLLVLFGFIYVATALSLGILISSVTKTQQVAMMLAQTTTLLPAVMLSGFIFAIRNMPVPLQAISYIVPARYFVRIIRGIMLKGASIEVLAAQAAALVGLMVLFMFLAARKFSTRIG